MCIESGFLIVKTFPALYKELVGRYGLRRDVYGLPRIDRDPQDCKIRYHGMDRDTLWPFDDGDLLAEIRMAELQEEGKCDETGFLYDPWDVQDVLDFLDEKQVNYEVIWTKIASSFSVPPNNYISIGYEPSIFDSVEHCSASCDCMLFPRYHGTDEEGTLFLEHFQKLNVYGVYNSPDEAAAFLEYYLSFDWTERGEFEIAEVYVSQNASW
jgi:hypothetical protein